MFASASKLVGVSTSIDPLLLHFLDLKKKGVMEQKNRTVEEEWQQIKHC